MSKFTSKELEYQATIKFLCESILNLTEEQEGDELHAAAHQSLKHLRLDIESAAEQPNVVSMTKYQAKADSNSVLMMKDMSDIAKHYDHSICILYQENPVGTEDPYAMYYSSGAPYLVTIGALELAKMNIHAIARDQED